MRRYIFQIIKKKKEEEARRKGQQVPLYKEPPLEIEPSEEDESADIDGNDGVIDFNINDPKNIVNNLRL